MVAHLPFYDVRNMDPCTSDPSVGTFQAINPLLADLGGFTVRRFLPRRERRMVGPWCFLDAFGPIAFGPQKAMDVPPHPHIGLQTVSWVVEGEILHKDSLGLQALARPGTLNLMTAGGGIAHAEETPPENSGRLHGFQLWVALPDAHRNTEPAFDHHPSLPAVDLPGGRATVFVGELAGARSGTRMFSPIVGAELHGAAGACLHVPLAPDFEHALLPCEGHPELDGHTLTADTLYYLGTGRRELAIRSGPSAFRSLLIGGTPFGEAILMWWNFVARTSDEIREARDDWQAGRRFGEVRAYSGPRLDAPPLVARPVPPNPMS
jgi:redox-sensitive bicupin YhaK (pirin superfamily)